MVGHDGQEYDIAALSQRVTNADALIASLRSDVTKLQDARNPQWIAVLGAAAAVAVVIGGFLSTVLSPMNSELATHENKLNRLPVEYATTLSFKEDRDNLNRRIARDEDEIKRLDDTKLDRREHNDFKSYTDKRNESQETRVTAIDGNLVKRPEIQATFDALSARVDALSTRLTANDKIFTDFLNSLVAQTAATKK